MVSDSYDFMITSLCMLGNVACFFVICWFFFQNQLFKNYFRNTISVSIIWIWEMQWLSGRVLDSRPRVRASPASLRCGPWVRHFYSSLVLVQPRKTDPCLTERLLMRRKQSNQNQDEAQHFVISRWHWQLSEQESTKNMTLMHQVKPNYLIAHFAHPHHFVGH